MKLTFAEIACHRCGLPAKLTKIPPTGRILNCELCGEFGIRTVDGNDIYTELKLPYGSDFCEALGRFVIAFSMAENGLDFLNDAILRYAGGRRIAKRLPKNFESKIKYLIKAIEQLDALQFRAIELRETAAIFENLVERRHYYIHGVYGTTFSEPLSFEKTIFKGESISFDQLAADITSIKDDATSAMAVGAFFLATSNLLASRSISSKRG